MLDVDMKVIGKGLKGKHETPVLTLGNVEGDRLKIHLESKKALDMFHLQEIYTVEVKKIQQTLPE